MRIISILLLLCLSFNALASTGSVAEFKAIMDDYEYSMNVEWDQNDPAFFQRKMKETTDKLEALTSKGMAKKDMLEFIEMRHTDGSTIDNFRAAQKILPTNASATEIINFWNQNSSHFYAKGASWTASDNVWTIGIWVTISAFIAFAVYDIVTHPCGEIVYNQTRHRNVCTGVKKK
jgi:hypothetical protein